MKKNTYLISCILVCLLGMMSIGANAQTWDFTSLSDADKTLLTADATNWYDDTASSRYNLLTAISSSALTANGTELAFTTGLKFTALAGSGNTSGKIRLNYKSNRLEFNGNNTLIISNLTAGQTVTLSCKTSSSSTARGFNVTNLTPVSGSFNATSTDAQTDVATVTADGEVTLTSTGGMYIYSLSITSDGGGSGGGTTPTTKADQSTTLDTSTSQVQLTTTGNVVKYYNSDALSDISIDKTAGTVTVTPSGSTTPDVYTKTVRNLTFSKVAETAANATITNHGVEITEAKGWNESVYAKWNILDGATTYHVYIKGGDYADYTKIDASLVRNYGTYGRADVLGLKAGSSYAVKVVPVISGAEDASKASEATGMTVANYDRSGFAHLNNSGVGAYNDEGTLKSNARVLYVTASTAKTVTLDVQTGSKSTSTFTGLQAILAAFEKGYETRPLDVRIIGTITATDMDALLSSEGLQIKGKSNAVNMNITLEGVGEDAGMWGFGMLLRNAVNVELRNFAVMLCLDDAVSLDTDNKYCWVHNMDFFYGKQGSDADQVKGDGTVDIKGNSQYITVAYNHFFDNGKSSLCGMTSESGPNYIDYHHNWFDHSDSRHPRVRTMTVHVWNNYYDGCAKYGPGATMGASVFVENNYFRSTHDPMLISKQGTDATGSGTFSGEDGGMIKSYGNVYAEKGTSGNYTPITQNASATSFDCYEASSRDEQVPTTYVTLAGGTTYNNFDTDAKLMYSYTPLAGVLVPSVVKGYWGAGRINKGDFKWIFTNSTDDASYAVNTALKTALTSYASTLVGIFGE